MKQITGWWFSTKEKRLLNNDGREIKIGVTHTFDGEIIPCKRGLHLSKNIIDALRYAPGEIIWKVRGWGDIKPHGNPVDKYACSKRTYLAGGIDATEILWKFARWCALDVIHLWDAPAVVVEYLKTENEKLRSAARSTASSVAWSVERSAKKDSTEHGVWSAAWSAAEYGAWSAASSAAESAARSTEWSTEWSTARDRYNSELTKMIKEIIK